MVVDVHSSCFILPRKDSQDPYLFCVASMSTLLHPEQIKCNIIHGRIKIRMYGDPDEGVSRDFANPVGDCEDELMTGRGWILLKNGMKGNRGLLGNGSQVVRPTENAVCKTLTFRQEDQLTN